MICRAHPDEYEAVEGVWWASVQATHQFISSEYLLEIKSKIKSDYLPQVELYVWREQGQVKAFLGMSTEAVEMLFVHPNSSGRGIGQALLTFAVQNGRCHVDVNEANKAVLAFYEKQGFRIVGRTEHDSAGKPYPILHLATGMKP